MSPRTSPTCGWTSGAVFRAQEQRAAAGEFFVTQLARVPVLAGA